MGNCFDNKLKNMKYGVFVALVATVSARHHQSELISTPDESRAAW